MATQNFDQLNNLRGYAETWFSKMEIPDKDKKKRVDLAMDFTEIMLMLFELIMESQISKDAAKAFLVERTKIIADNYIGKENTAYITDWSRLESEKIVEDTYKMVAEAKKSEETKKKEPTELSSEPSQPAEKPMDETEVEEVAETTKNSIHFDEYDVDIPKEEYPTSDFRGMLLGVECATSVANYDDFYQAVEKHGATRKVWISEADGRVRATHDEAHGQERPIAKLFEVGGSELMFPGDITHGADMKEIYNCRCHVSYIYGNSPKVMDYRKERAENSEREFDTKGPKIRAKAIVNSPNNIYVSNDSNVKPRKLQEIEKLLSKYFEMFNKNGYTKPTIVVVSDNELSKVSGGRYSAEDNTLYIKPTIESELQDEIIKHELIHWTDAQEYILEGNTITDNTEYINIMCERCKPILDKLGINADNVGEISTYAKNSYAIGRYDEAYTEYRVHN